MAGQLDPSVLIATVAALVGASAATGQQWDGRAPATSLAAAVATTAAFEFRSDPLFNLHDFLVWNAATDGAVDPRPECLAGVPPEDRAAFERALRHYAETFVGPTSRSLTVALWFRLAGFPQVEILPDSALAPTVEHLRAASPAYERCWWADHDARNRRWIADLVERLDTHEAALQSLHNRLYQATWNVRIPVDVVGYVSWAGAGTVVNPDHILIASADARHDGDAALEIVFHEASHTLLGPRNGAVWEALEVAARSRGQERLAQELIHPIIFYTSGRLVEARIAEHEGRDYRPYVYAQQLFERAWPGFQQPLEQHWQGYLDGRTSLGEAAERLVAAVAEGPG